MRFNRLPTEIQYDVFATLSAKDLCTIVAPACRQWRQFAYEPTLWQCVHLDGKTQTQSQIKDIVQHATRIRNLKLISIRDSSLLMHLPKRESLRQVLFLHCSVSSSLLSSFPVLFPYVQICEIVPTLDSWQNLFIGWNYLTVIKIVGWFTLSGVRSCLEVITKECKNVVDFKMNLMRETEEAFVNFLKVRGHQLQHLCFVCLANVSSMAYRALIHCCQLRTLNLDIPRKLTDVDFVGFITELKTLESLYLFDSRKLFSNEFLSLYTNNSFPPIEEVHISYCYNLNAEAVNTFVKCCHFNILIMSMTSMTLTLNECISIASANELEVEVVEKDHKREICLKRKSKLRMLGWKN